MSNLGYYFVGNTPFVSKISALLAAKQSGKPVRWDFNSRVWGSIDWTTPVETDITQLYLMRAQQLRDKYDYIVLYFSGGADSVNILNTFVDNNILIDEIVMLLPAQDRKNFRDLDTSSRNLNGEIDYVAIPYLKKISHKLNSTTKITIRDYSDSLLSYVGKDSWIEKLQLGVRFSPNALSWQLAEMSDSAVHKFWQSGRTVCHLYGADKPLVLFQNNNYYAFFVDSNIHHIQPVELNNISGASVTTEAFYWSADFPLLVVKQCQMIKQACLNNSYLRLMWSRSLSKGVGDYRSIMHPIIYPDVEKPRFQTEKVPSLIIKTDGFDDWFWGRSSDSQKHNYLEALSYVKKNIGPEYIKGQTSGITQFETVPFYSEFYKI